MSVKGAPGGQGDMLRGIFSPLRGTCREPAHRHPCEWLAFIYAEEHKLLLELCSQILLRCSVQIWLYLNQISCQSKDQLKHKMIRKFWKRYQCFWKVVSLRLWSWPLIWTGALTPWVRQGNAMRQTRLIGLKSTGAFTSRSPQAASIWRWELVIGNCSMRGSILSDNSPVGFLVFLGFATRVISVLTC